MRIDTLLKRLVALLIVLSFVVGMSYLLYGEEETPTELDANQRARLLAIFGGESLPEPPRYDGVEVHSHYVSGEGGTPLAVDVYLPEGATGPLPAILTPTRYWRRWDVVFPTSLLLGPNYTQRFFTSHGYAVVMMDVRGSGASFGTRPHPWAPDEVADYGHVMDWIVAQPWSDGHIAASGISYAGTAAEFAATLGHPALKAVVPTFSLYDAYTDIAFPGGVFNEYFVRNWGEFNRQLDAGEVPEALPFFVGWFINGPMSVEGAEERLPKALAEHSANVDIHAAASEVSARDEVSSLAGATIDDFSPHSHRRALAKNAPPIFGFAGWYDGAYADAALKRLAQVRVPQRLVIGPWNHAATHHVSPYLPPDTPSTPGEPILLAEQLRFLDFYLRGKGQMPEPGIVYYTFGAEEWRFSPVWPPVGQQTQRLYLRAGDRLTPAPPDTTGGAAPASETEPRTFVVDYRATSVMPAGTDETGTNTTRWHTQLGRSDVIYGAPPIGPMWLSEPLETPVELTGSPALTVELASNAPDGALFVYLHDVAPDGHARYITEGMLRLAHRAGTFRLDDMAPMPADAPTTVTVPLLPISVQLAEGHRLRVTLTGHDAAIFAPVGRQSPPTYTIHHAGGVSYLSLPVMSPAATTSATP